MIERTVIYFEKPGRDNTPACIEATAKAINNLSIKHLVVATTTGDTGLKFTEALRDLDVNIVVVTHSSGFKEPNTLEMTSTTRDEIQMSGATVYTGTMPTHSLDSAFANQFSGSYLTQIVANSLRRFGEGAKVCCEIAMMACDAGLIPEDEEIIAVAGSARGADTVAVIKSAATKRFLKLKVLEIIAKPRT